MERVVFNALANERSLSPRDNFVVMSARLLVFMAALLFATAKITDPGYNPYPPPARTALNVPCFEGRSRKRVNRRNFTEGSEGNEDFPSTNPTAKLHDRRFLLVLLRAKSFDKCRSSEPADES